MTPAAIHDGTTAVIAAERAVLIDAAFEEVISGARHALAIRVRKGTLMASPKAARDYLTLRLGAHEHEVFTILFLDFCGANTNVEM